MSEKPRQGVLPGVYGKFRVEYKGDHGQSVNYLPRVWCAEPALFDSEAEAQEYIKRTKCVTFVWRIVEVG